MSGTVSSAWLDGGSTGWFARLYRDYDWDWHDGIRIAVFPTRSAAKAESLTRVRAALDTLRAVAPAQWARLPSTVHSIAVGPAHGPAACWRRDIRAILLDRDVLLSDRVSTEWLATTLIHELTHARLERAGFEYQVERRARLERICRLAERNFIARLPPSDERARLARRNARDLASRRDHWSDAAFAARYEAWLAKQPAWRRVLLQAVSVVRRAHYAALSNDR